MASQNVEVVRRGYELFNRGEIDAAIEGMDPDIEWTVLEVLPDTQTYHGPEGVRRFWERWRETFEEFQVEPEELLDAGDQVVVVFSPRGRGRGSGATVQSPAIAQVWTLREGKPVRVEMYPSRATALEAVGLEESTK
jgi:ketosteroid isomerase-like protein